MAPLSSSLALATALPHLPQTRDSLGSADGHSWRNVEGVRRIGRGTLWGDIDHNPAYMGLLSGRLVDESLSWAGMGETSESALLFMQL